MASFTTPTIHATADDLAITDWNAVANNTTFLWQTPYASVYNSVSTNITTGALTDVGLQSTTSSGYGFSLSGNQLLVPVTGVYFVTGAVTFGSGAPSQAVGFCYISANGTAIGQGGAGAPGGSQPTFTATQIVSLSANAPLALGVFQDSGSTLGTQTGAGVTYLSAFLIGSQ